MKLVHASLPADRPQEVARILAEIMGGEAMPFPPAGPEAWMAWSGDGAIELEVVRRGDVLEYGEEEGGWRPCAAPQQQSEVHLAIAVDRSAAEVQAIAAAAGWPARHCWRGGGVFDLTEVWVEGRFMIEFLDPDQAAHYGRTVTPASWKAFLAQMQAV